MNLADPASMALFFTELVYASPFGILLLFFFALLANASVFFPILVEPVVFAVAALAPDIWAALLLGIVAGTAAAIGEMSGYILGLFGVKTLQKMSEAKVEKIFELGEKLADKGMPIIFLGSFTPFPFDLMGIAGGIIKYDPKRFFAAAAAGKILRYSLVALAGFLGIAWLRTMPWLKALLGL